MSIEDLWKQGEPAALREHMEKEVTQICHDCGLKMDYVKTLGWVCRHCRVGIGHNGAKVG